MKQRKKEKKTQPSVTCPKGAPRLLQREEFQNLEILSQVQVAPKHKEEREEKEGSS